MATVLRGIAFFLLLVLGGVADGLMETGIVTWAWVTAVGIAAGAGLLALADRWKDGDAP